MWPVSPSVTDRLASNYLALMVGRGPVVRNRPAKAFRVCFFSTLWNRIPNKASPQATDLACLCQTWVQYHKRQRWTFFPSLCFSLLNMYIYVQAFILHDGFPFRITKCYKWFIYMSLWTLHMRNATFMVHWLQKSHGHSNSKTTILMVEC